MRVKIERKPTVEEVIRLLTSHGQNGLFILEVRNGIVWESAPLEAGRSEEWRDWLRQALTSQPAVVGG